MKRIITNLILLFIIVFLTGCKKQPKEEMIILTSQEKIELLQEMKMPTRNLFLLEASLNADVYEKNLSYIIDCDISSYFDLTDIKSFKNYTQIDFDVKTPNYDGLGSASFFVDNTNAYLDIDTFLKIEGTETTIKSKEVMDLNKLIDPEIVIDYYNKINLDALNNLDPEEIVKEANDIIDFIDVYQKGNEYRFEVKITKERLIAIGGNINYPLYAEMISGLSNDSDITFSINFSNNTITKIDFLGNVNVALGNGTNVEAEASFVIDFVPNTPQLPTSILLNRYTPVEFFTILDKLGTIFE